MTNLFAAKEASPVNPGKIPGAYKMFLVPFLLIAIGTTFVHYHERWDWMTSLYVITQIVTTVGFGDYAFKSQESKVFMSCFIIVLLAVVGFVVGAASEHMVAGQGGVLKNYLEEYESSGKNKKGAKEAKESFQAFNDLLAASIPALGFIVFGTLFYWIMENCSCGFGIERIAGCNETSYDTCKASGGYVKHFVDCFYMSVITLSTVGFGDQYPRSEIGRWVCIPWMLFGVVIFGNAIGQTSSYFYDKKVSDKMMAKEAAMSISEETFKAIDTDGNGFLDKSEFVIYTLYKYGIVTEELLHELRTTYEGFDCDADGGVTFEEISKRSSMRASQTEAENPEQISFLTNINPTESESPELEVPPPNGRGELP